MPYPFNQACRTEIADRVAAFRRLPKDAAGQALKQAAVAIVLVEAGEASGETAFLLTRRATGLRSHGGQWALPGGRCDAGETPAEAALRELDEEIGLKLGAADVLGVLDDYPTRSGYLVTPVVAWAVGSAALRLNREEVSSVHRIPLAEIMRPDVVDFTTIPESRRQVVRMAISGDIIHAPTAALIYQFREVLAGRATRVNDLEQPLFAWR
ncbi:NUDIX hydrolase [Phreatobacter stygius]|uniref:CoA pyrophosphatase n=1 Tax=Phreatobacter stygius TaxID=1940610 RepID=A0A4D7B7K3_9HYPH|nr:CoA pyrophosphatase [Phreatobacter stygius]QCI69244.1 CoA pyrophosphatase [Phreatobacter stygius]